MWIFRPINILLIRVFCRSKIHFWSERRRLHFLMMLRILSISMNQVNLPNSVKVSNFDKAFWFPEFNFDKVSNFVKVFLVLESTLSKFRTLTKFLFQTLRMFRPQTWRYKPLKWRSKLVKWYCITPNLACRIPKMTFVTYKIGLYNPKSDIANLKNGVLALLTQL